jgi:KDO2-lipid IV(A) lauroyltransferase
MRALGPRGQARLAAVLAWVGWHLRIRRAVTLDNLRQAFPGWPAARREVVAREAYRHLALAAIEAVSADLVPDAALAERVVVDDWRGLDVLLAARQPVLVASAHFGSWELLAEVMARRGVSLSAVVRPLAGAFNAWVFEVRRRAGVGLISERGALRGMLRALREGRAVVQLIDQALPSPRALEVRFFGRAATMTPALSLAALRSGAPVFVVLAHRDGNVLRMVVEPVPLPPLAGRRAAVQAHAQALTDVLERAVRAHPGQWLWLHRRWKPRPAGRR